jgi:lysozyme family protein
MVSSSPVPRRIRVSPEEVWVRAFAHTVGVEGDYSDDPKDSGGKTRYGITERVARAHGYTGPMDELPIDLAGQIYRSDYWDLIRLDDVAELSPDVACELFDSAVNVGQAMAVMWLQRSLNALNDGASRWPDVPVDRLMTPVTLHALAGQLHRPKGEQVLLKALNALQGAHYIALAEARPKDERFVAGWFAQRVGGLA